MSITSEYDFGLIWKEVDTELDEAEVDPKYKKSGLSKFSAEKNASIVAAGICRDSEQFAACVKKIKPMAGRLLAIDKTSKDGQVSFEREHGDLQAKIAGRGRRDRGIVKQIGEFADEMSDNANSTMLQTIEVIKHPGTPTTTFGANLLAGCVCVEIVAAPAKQFGAFFIAPVVKRACDLTPETRKGCGAIADTIQKVAPYVHKFSSDLERSCGVSASLITHAVTDLPLLSGALLKSLRPLKPQVPCQTIPLATRIDMSVAFLPKIADELSSGQGVRYFASHPSKIVEVFQRNAHLVSKMVEREKALYRLAAQSRTKDATQTALYILPKTGNRHTYFPGFHFEFLDQALNKTTRFSVARVSNEKELALLLAKEKNVSLMWISAHGTPSSISLSYLQSVSGTDLVKHWSKNVFTHDAKLIIEACETAKIPSSGGLSVAAQIHKQLEGRLQVIAPTEPHVVFYDVLKEAFYGKTIRTNFHYDGEVKFSRMSDWTNSEVNLPIGGMMGLGPPGITLRRGDICRVKFSGEKGVRPAVVISNNTMNCKLENQTLLIAPMTTNIKRIYPHEVQYFSIFNSKEGKIQLNNIQAISRTSIIQKLGELDEVTLSKVETAIKYVLAIK